jgi:hypothetical protein
MRLAAHPGHLLKRDVKAGELVTNLKTAPRCHVAFWQIVLQKSKVAGLQIFRENTKREAIADSYNLIRVSEVTYEFNTRR